ncbi:MAG: DNA polymerase/3'-5' exonuclease PolX [Phycisphaerae bacterium]|jgi:DNA polymerase (family 10)
MSNREIAAAFTQIADLLEVKGEDRFRVNAYRSAGRAVADLSEDLAVIAGRGDLAKIPGIGKTTAAKIEEYLATGRIALHQELLAEFPPGLPRLLEVRGLGPKKVAALYRELKIGSLEELRAAIADGRVAGLKGFGAKTAANILEGIAFLERAGERMPLGLAVELAGLLREAVGGFPHVRRVEIAGSLRRGRETVGDLDLLCEADAGHGQSIIERFTKLPQVASVLAAGETRGSVLIDRRDGGQIQCDLRVVPRESFGAAWNYFTGSKEHNVRLRELAVKRGWSLNEYALHEGERRIAGEDEAGLYKALGLAFIPPELRENRGEIEAGGVVPDLIEQADVRGELHSHTTASDGHLSIEQMVEAARARGYSYLAITDHSRSSVIANGLSVERLLRHAAEIRRINAGLKNFTLLAGVECDILPDGSLDYPDEVLAQLDWVVASVHSSQRLDRAAQTRRTLAALSNRYVCVLGHPSGRLIGKRDAMDLDWDAVFKTAAKTGTALEINANWLRLDLKDVHVRQALQAGCRLSINTDAHSAEDLDQMVFGVQTARRGWATRSRVLNTLTADELTAWVAQRRGR